MGTAENAFNISEKDLYATKLFTVDKCAKILEQRINTYPTQLHALCQQHSIVLISIFDDQYPLKLKTIANPPIVLYTKGNKKLLNQNCIGIVGSRKATPYGLKVSDFFADRLSRAGLVIISGGARGIDTASHLAALKTDKTICVLGCGIDITYPRENKELFEQIADHGLMLSEYPPSTSPIATNFPARNRIIAGIASGIILVEAAKKSGGLITAEFAMDEGREVYCVPGNIFSVNSAGVHSLLKQGAKLIDSPEDILEDFHLTLTTRENNQNYTMKNLFIDVPEDKKAMIKLIYNAFVNDEPLAPDEIVLKTGLNIQTVNKLLINMMINGYIDEIEGKRYIRL